MGEVGQLSPELEDAYFIWRLVFEGNQSLTEVENWDLPSIVQANEILNMKADISAAYSEASKPEKMEK